MFCKKCGKQLRDDVNFCGKCGIKVAKRGIVPDISEPEFVNFEERVYEFKNMPDLNDVIKLLKGGVASFVITEDMLIIQEERKHQDKFTAIPYNEIKSFGFEDYLSMYVILSFPIIFIFCFMIIEYGEFFIGMFLIIFAIFLFLISVYRSRFSVNVSDGRTFKIKLKRIHRDKTHEQIKFIADLVNMVNNADVLSNITKQESNIKTGYAKANWGDVFSDLIDKF